MPAALSDAQIHHIGTTRNRRGGEHLTHPTGDTDMAELAELKSLSKAVTDGFTELKVQLATMTTHIDHAIQGQADHETRLRVVEQRVDLSDQVDDLRKDVEALKGRPAGLTGRQLLAALGSTAGIAAALATVIDKVHIG